MLRERGWGGERAGAGRGAATASSRLPAEGWRKWGAQKEESSKQRAQPHQRDRGEGTSSLGLELRGEKAEAERARPEGPEGLPCHAGSWLSSGGDGCHWRVSSRGMMRPDQPFRTFLWQHVKDGAEDQAEGQEKSCGT